jgi:uncharacterized membrane protein YsdA (DUF1294 family)
MIVVWSICILGGIYGYLLVYDVIKPFGKETEQWHKQYDKKFKIGLPIMILCSLILIISEITK